MKTFENYTYLINHENWTDKRNHGCIAVLLKVLLWKFGSEK